MEEAVGRDALGWDSGLLGSCPGTGTPTLPWPQFPSLYWGQWEALMPQVFGALTLYSSELVEEREG